MLTVSLAVNVLALTPVTTGLLGDAGWALRAFGPRSPARGILTAVSSAMLIGSAALRMAGIAGGDGLVAPTAGL